MTAGHLDMVRRASAMFGRVTVAVAAGHHKKTMFTLDERLHLARASVADMPNVDVRAFDGLVRDFALQSGASVMVRGLRSGTDLDYEHQLAGMNLHLMPQVQTVFLLPLPQWQSVSSTLVREIATLGGPQQVRPFVPPPVFEALCRKLGKADACTPA